MKSSSNYKTLCFLVLVNNDAMNIHSSNKESIMKINLNEINIHVNANNNTKNEVKTVNVHLLIKKLVNITSYLSPYYLKQFRAFVLILEYGS